MSEPRTFFKDGYIRLTQLSALNDPFEAAFCEESLEDLASNFDDTMALDGTNGEVTFSQYVKNHLHHVGVICFAESKDNLLMWSHYGNEHKGLVAGISTFSIDKVGIFNDLLEVGESFVGNTLFNGIPKPVSYRKSLRYRNDRFDYDYSNISVEGAEKMLYEVFMQKSEEWVYEKEHRVVLKLEQADKVLITNLSDFKNKTLERNITNGDWYSFDDTSNIHEFRLNEIESKGSRAVFGHLLAGLSKNPKNVYLMKLQPSAISHCILGLECAFRDDVIGDYATSIGRFEVWQARKNIDYYSLEFDELD